MADIIKCIIVDDERVAREILETHLSKIDQLEIIASCKNALEAFTVINTQDVNLVFLDINMPEISGLSFAKSMNKQLKIIFTTAYREYAVDGFDLQAVDYLLKPISFERLLQAVNKFLQESIKNELVLEPDAAEERSGTFFVRSERKMVKVCIKEILFIESISDYLKIYLKNNNTVITRETLSNIEARLPQKEFLRIHRSFIASIANIDSFTNETIEINKRELPISRSYKSVVLDRLS